MNNSLSKRNMKIRQNVEKEIEKFIKKNKKEHVLHMTEFDDYVSSISSLPEDYLCSSEEVLLKTRLFGLFIKCERDYEKEKKSNDVKITRPKSTPIISNEPYTFIPIP